MADSYRLGSTKSPFLSLNPFDSSRNNSTRPQVESETKQVGFIIHILIFQALTLRRHLTIPLLLVTTALSEEHAETHSRQE
jgi:hypothetical protein